MECKAPSPAIIVVSGMAFEAGMVRGAGIIPIYGLDPAKLKHDIKQTLQEHAIAGLLSFGTAAGLAPPLQPGTIIIARFIHTQQENFATHERWAHALQAALPDAQYAAIAGVDHPVVSVEAKARLYADSGAAIADMESHHVVQIAQEYNLPFAALRVVLDGADCALPPAALRATSNDGSINYSGLIASLLSKPGQLPALLKLAKAQTKARQSLLRCGNFFIHKANCFGLMDIG